MLFFERVFCFMRNISSINVFILVEDYKIFSFFLEKFFLEFFIFSQHFRNFQLFIIIINKKLQLFYKFIIYELKKLYNNKI